MPTFPVLTEGVRWGAAIMSEANFHRSREDCKVPAETTILINGLVARLATVADLTIVEAPVAGNTGNATIVKGSPAATRAAKDGVYKGIAITATTVRWEDPDGKEIGTSTHGTPFNKEIKFTITAGGNANVAGDSFPFEVRSESGDYTIVPFAHGGSDGSEIPFGYSPYGYVTPAGKTKRASILVRDCELNGNCIAWPAGISAAQKQNAIDALEKRGVIVRF